MNQDILQFCIEKGVLVDKNILEIFSEFEDQEIAKNLIERINFRYKQKIINKSFFNEDYNRVIDLISNYKGIDRKIIESFFNKLGFEIKENIEYNDVSSEEVEEDLKFMNLSEIYQNNPKKIEVSDFVKNFKSRFNFLKRVLQDRSELENLVSINRLENNQQVFIIALVFDKRITKNGNVLLEIEDLTGKTIALINKNREDVFEKSKEILLDEVVALKCSSSGEIVFVNDIIFPDAKIFEKKKSKIDESAAFISDIHIGSNKFLKNNFERFIKWINGEVGSEKQKKEALKIKYLFITGDSIDGVGVFPGQENELDIKDVLEQYKLLAIFLSRIREDVEIVICAGQHDAVRLAEPQPIIGDNYAEPLYYLKNINFATNPSLVEIGQDVKFKILMYHGASMHGVVNSIEALRLGKGHDSPTDIVKYLLKKRHLAPTHSLVTYTPFEEDPLLIREVPDIIATGDLHRPEVADYNGVLMIASSCWQARTPFEEKVGNNPDPCKVPVFNLKTREVKILDFSGGDSDGGEDENS
ncbi:DNA polymerase II [Candidatus Pacearchaeota archaeon]|nr:DNA polymerase II [Candidatus Pacearchaeota archaeon]